MPVNGEGPVASPCLRNCCLDEEDICLGCFRTLTEIMHWSESDDDRRRAILRAAEARQAAHRSRWSRD